MEDNFYLQNCGNEDVMSFGSKLLKAGEFRNTVKSTSLNKREIPTVIYSALKQNHGIEILSSSWYDEGIDCEILKLGSKGWQKGKVRIKIALEFCSDEPEIEETLVSKQAEINQSQSPLDDIRQIMNGNS